MTRTFGAFGLLLSLSACEQDPINTTPEARPYASLEDAMAAAQRVSGDATTGFAACEAISYDIDGDGMPDADEWAKVYGKDVDTDGYAGEPVSTTNIFEEGSSTGATYVCSFTWPSGFVEITDPDEVNADCDDSATGAAINPAATEVCDTVDNDCDGTADDGVTRTWYPDVDADTYGDETDSGTMSCVTSMTGYVEDHTDCDDSTTGGAINPGATEICDAWDTDEDCDGNSDNDDSSTSPSGMTVFYTDSDGDTYGDETDTGDWFCDMPSGYSASADDCNDVMTVGVDINPGESESCNGIDDDCDSSIDEDVESTFYADTDGDGYGDATVTDAACSVSAGWVADNTDCDDTSSDAADRYPGNTEVCDGIDNDCVDGADSGLTFTSYYTDADGDGYGSGSGTSLCSDPGTGYSLLSTDCNDLVSTTNPGGSEVCDSGTADEDCDGLVDDDDSSATGQTTWYADLDGDGFGLSASGTTSTCDMPSGYSAVSTDCDETDEFTYPGAAFEESSTDCMTDVDGDGFGEEDAASGVDDGTDCNDDDDDVNPDATDVADNGLDDDCDNTATDLICETDTFTSASVFKQLWLDSQDATADDADWAYPGLARGEASDTTETCASRTITGGEVWKIQGQFSTSATSGTFYASSWTFSAYMNASTNFASVTVMGEAVTVENRSWGGGADGFFTVATTLPN